MALDDDRWNYPDTVINTQVLLTDPYVALDNCMIEHAHIMIKSMKKTTRDDLQALLP